MADFGHSEFPAIKEVSQWFRIGENMFGYRGHSNIRCVTF